MRKSYLFGIGESAFDMHSPETNRSYSVGLAASQNMTPPGEPDLLIMSLTSINGTLKGASLKLLDLF